MKVAAGIDIGGTNTAFGIVTEEGDILAEGSVKTKDFEQAEVFVAALYEMIELTVKRLDNTYNIAGYGIGAPMGNINKGTVEYAATLPWKGIVPLGSYFKKHTSLPVIITNDANAAAAGEMIYGGARGMKNFVVITLGTGLGSGLVVNGQLVYGEDGFAGELGHTTIRPGLSNRECGCGKTGCLETYVSASGIKRTLLKIMADSIEDSELREFSFNDLDAKKIHDAALKGDPIALMAFKHTGEMLGFKLADLVAHTNPEAIFLFGGLALAEDFIFEPAKKSMNEHLLNIFKDKVKLLPSELSVQNAAVLGASSLVWAENKK